MRSSAERLAPTLQRPARTAERGVSRWEGPWSGRGTAGRASLWRQVRTGRTPHHPPPDMATTTRSSGSSTAIVAIVAIAAMLALVWFFFLRGGAPAIDGGGGGTNINVEVPSGGAAATE